MTAAPEHDPAFPFVMISLDGKALAKFASFSLAQSAARREGYQVRDTRPVADDVEFLTWVSGSQGERMFATRSEDGTWEAKGPVVTFYDITGIIADAPDGLTILDRRAVS